LKLINIETIGERIYASFDTDQRFEVLFVFQKDNEYFMKVSEHQRIRFYKVSFRDFNVLEKKFTLMGINKSPQKE
jgi:hypothetical protein